MREFAMRFLRNQGAGTAVEYGLIVALIGIVVMGGMATAFGAITNKFNFIANTLSSGAS